MQIQKQNLELKSYFETIGLDWLTSTIDFRYYNALFFFFFK